jgi:hypothetical protein
VGKPEGKSPLGRPRHRWMDSIKMNMREIRWGGVDWIDLAEDRDQWMASENTVMNLLVPHSVRNHFVPVLYLKTLRLYQ